MWVLDSGLGRAEVAPYNSHRALSTGLQCIVSGGILADSDVAESVIPLVHLTRACCLRGIP